MMPLDRGVKGSGKIAMRKAKLLLRILFSVFGCLWTEMLGVAPRCSEVLRVFGFRFSLSTAREIVLGFVFYNFLFRFLRFVHFGFLIY